MKTAKDRDGLNGPVHTVGLSVTRLPARIQRPDTSGRTIEQDVTYSPEGRKLEEITYGGEDRALQSRKVFITDESQHIGWTMFGSDGALLERFVCVHDPDGKRTEYLTYGGDGKLQRRQVRDYDKDSKQCEDSTYGPDGTLMWKDTTIYDDLEREIETSMEMPMAVDNQGRSQKHRTVCTYGDSGDIFELASYSGNTLSGRFVFVNPEGHISQVFHYDGGALLQSKEIIERLKFDDHGNWTEERVSTWVAGAAKTEPTEVEPTELHHRIITYY